MNLPRFTPAKVLWSLSLLVLVGVYFPGTIISLAQAAPPSAAPSAGHPDVASRITALRRTIGVRFDAQLTEDDLRTIKGAGFTAIRLAIKPFALTQKEPYRINPEFLARLDRTVEQATKLGLGVVIDLHEHKFIATDQADFELVYFWWREIAKRYATFSNDLLYFEILNEPNGPVGDPEWREIFNKSLAIIRAGNPDRPVIIGPIKWNKFENLDSLQLPEGDRNLVVTVHYYLPRKFTHQNAEWAGTTAYRDVSWGSAEEFRFLADSFETVAQWSREHHRPIFVGEFGASKKGAQQFRVKYIGAVRREAEKHGFFWSIWNYDDGDFGIYDRATKSWNQEILAALFGGH